MSNNTIRAHMTLSFKGETHDFDTLIDLDHCAAEPGEPPNFHQILARAAGIDTYSYLYEVLESHDIEFSDATGLAARSCADGEFDWFLFEQDRREEQEWQQVRAIAEQYLPGRELDADQKAALLAAYQAGRKHGAG